MCSSFYWHQLVQLSYIFDNIIGVCHLKKKKKQAERLKQEKSLFKSFAWEEDLLFIY